MLGLGLGSTLATPVAGFCIHHFGSRAVILGAGLVFCLLLPGLVLAPTAAVLAAGLVVFGAAVSMTDVAMNAQAVVVETAAGRPLMSGFHGRFSLGGLVGAAGSSLLLFVGGTPLLAACLLAALGIGILLSQAPHLLPYMPAVGSAFRLPRGRLVLIGLLCLIGYFAEGAMLDWSAVFLRFTRGADAGVAGFGYALFSVTMALGRLLGDRVQARIGARRVLRWGAFIGAAGLFLAGLVPSVPVALMGLALVGIGIANIVPVLFGAAGRLPDMPPGPAISAVAAFGCAGLLAGPPLIGVVAGFTGLALALAGVGLLLLVLSLASGTVLAKETTHAA